jgi:WD40 repeat protein
LIRTLSIPAGRFRSLAFSPTSSHLAGGASDGMIRVWNPWSDDRPLLEIKHGKAVSLVRYSPTGKTLLSAGPAGAVRIWNLGDGSLVAEIPAGVSGMSDACFSPDGEQVVVASRDGSVRLWNVAAPERPRMISTDSHVTSLSFSDDGEMIAAGSYPGAVRIWSASDGTLLHTHQMLAGVGDVEFLRKSRVLAIAASDGAVHLYDVDARRELSKVSTHNLSLGLLARSADGRWLAVASGDGAVKRVRTKEILRPTVFWHDENVRAAAFLPGSRRVVAADPGALKIWDTESGESKELPGNGDEPISSISVHPGGKLIAAGALSTVTLWDVEALKSVEQIEAPGNVATVAFFPSGRWLAVAARQGPIFVYEFGKWREPRLRIESGGPALTALAVSLDETALVAALADGGVRSFDAETGAERRPPLRLSAVPRALCFGEEGRILAVGADTGEVHLWDWPSQNARLMLKAHSGRVNALAAMPGGRTLVSAGRDRDLKLFDTATGEAITSLAGHVRQVHCLAISPDGATIASGGLEGDLRIWRSR